MSPHTSKHGDAAVAHQAAGIGRPFSRRVLLRTGSLGAAAAGIVAAVPGLGSLLGASSSAGPELSGAAGDAGGLSEAPALAGPIVAHITDASTGDVSIYVGERELAYRDPTLVQHLLRAAR